MERISVFDIFKVGIGPSSSHTMGPWKAAGRFLQSIKEQFKEAAIVSLEVHLFGSLAKTGRGHGTDVAVILGLCGYHPETIPVSDVSRIVTLVRESKRLVTIDANTLSFDPSTQIVFHRDVALPYHPNGLTFKAQLSNGMLHEETMYSIGGGFVVKEGEEGRSSSAVLPCPIDSGEDLKKWCALAGSSVSKVVFENEKVWRSAEEILSGLDTLWAVMKESMFRGCHTQGILPGGLGVKRRAAEISQKLLGDRCFERMDLWSGEIKKLRPDFQEIVKWVSCFALAVNEENASFGRVVTAPTNGSAGVIPAVLMYHLSFNDKAKEEDARTFLLTAGEIGSLFKKGATISAALGGCQAEIGVSSAMAAGALTECLGGTSDQVMMAAEIAMEHHLGLTCDPIGGLVQVPCIERNTMGAIKAITASQIALESDPAKAKVSLDAVIKTMKETAKDMNTKYKETADGGLATNISVNVPEC
jgi:L-serine dehydratase